MLNLCTVRHLKNWCDQKGPNLTKFGNVISDCNICTITNIIIHFCVYIVWNRWTNWIT